MTQTVVGVFDTQAAALAAEQALLSRGFDRSALHRTAADPTSSTTEERDEGFFSGIGHFFSNLFGTDDSDEVGAYSEAVRRGAIVLTVDLPDGADVTPVRDVLEEAGAIDIDERTEYWRQQGWTGYRPDSSPLTAEEIANERKAVLPVVEEQLDVGKRQMKKGTVRVVSRTVETPVRENVQLREEHATIERRPVDRPATGEDLRAFDEKTVEVQETAEKAVVSKTARVVEEVRVGKEATEHTETIEGTVRHTEVQTQRDGGETGTTGTTLRTFEEYEPDYRQDFQTRYGAQGARYEEYAPAYRYGYTLASDARYRGRMWPDIEADAQRDWDRDHPGGTWERMKLAVRHGWERVTGQR